MSLRAAKDAARRSEEAWALYNVAKSPEQTKDAVTAFGNSGLYSRGSCGLLGLY